MIRWRSSTQLTYAGEQFADVFRATAQWSRTSHIPVDVASAQESVDHDGGRLWYDLEVLLALQTGGTRELASLAAHLADTLGPGWTLAQAGDQLRCEFDVARHAAGDASSFSTSH